MFMSCHSLMTSNLMLHRSSAIFSSIWPRKPLSCSLKRQRRCSPKYGSLPFPPLALYCFADSTNSGKVIRVWSEVLKRPSSLFLLTLSSSLAALCMSTCLAPLRAEWLMTIFPDPSSSITPYLFLAGRCLCRYWKSHFSSLVPSRPSIGATKACPSQSSSCARLLSIRFSLGSFPLKICGGQRTGYSSAEGACCACRALLAHSSRCPAFQPARWQSGPQ
mmetsp:Transcript_50382/g.146190  ORF Transcript_50382/g.146190 Transcript_50382/m.146190 type:complete len:219 (-) Transcript_50382:133-789(-)